MQISVDENGYVTSYALIGGFENGIEVPDSEDEEWFEAHFEGYKYENGELVYDEEHLNEILAKRAEPVIDAITELQLALAEVFEMLEGGNA